MALFRADIETVHRFADKEYAAISIQMRNREKPAELFDKLYERGHVRIHTSQEEALAVMTAEATDTIRAGGAVALSTPTNKVAVDINRLMQQQMAEAARTRTPKHEITGSDGIILRHGDVIITRSNDSMLGVANRETYTVANTHADGSITISQGKDKDSIRLPARYVKEHVHLGYASTEYGAQGATETTGAGLLDQSSSAAGSYVAATRGREANTLHLVATSTESARTQFVDTMNRDGADRGIDKAREALSREIDGLDLWNPPIPATVPPPRPEAAACVPPKAPERGPERANDNEPAATQRGLQNAAPEAAGGSVMPDVDVQLRERRTASEQHQYQRKLRAFESRRSEYEKKHGHSPDAWADLRGKANDECRAAKDHLGIVQARVADRAEQSYRAYHAAQAAAVNTARRNLSNAGMLGKRQEGKELDAVLTRYEQAFGDRPEGPVHPESPLDSIERIREQALTQDSPELAKARTIEAKAHQKLAEVLAAEPKWCTERYRPQPPTPGTPAQEAAKDRAYAGRRAQTKRLKAQDRAGGPSTSHQHGHTGPTR